MLKFIRCRRGQYKEEGEQKKKEQYVLWSISMEMLCYLLYLVSFGYLYASNHMQFFVISCKVVDLLLEIIIKNIYSP